jgi:hypothetical protein
VLAVVIASVLVVAGWLVFGGGAQQRTIHGSLTTPRNPVDARKRCEDSYAVTLETGSGAALAVTTTNKSNTGDACTYEFTFDHVGNRDEYRFDVTGLEYWKVTRRYLEQYSWRVSLDATQ